MSRSIPQSNIDAISDVVIKPFIAVRFDFDSGPFNLWNGVGPLVNGSDTYEGAGDLIGISNITESSNLSVEGATVTISGIPAENIALVIEEDIQYRDCIIQIGFEYNGSIEFAEVFSGFVDTADIDEDPDSASISINIENRLIELEKVKIRRYTSQDQKTKYPNDRGLEFIASLQNKQLQWGKNISN